jgi:hypothetical protein
MMKAATLESNPGISPNGRTFLYWKDSKYQAWDLDTGTTKTLGGASTVSFVDTEDDHPGPKPAYGIAGYTPDGTAAIAQHRYDLWLLPLDGSAPKNLTNGLGAKNEVRYRIVRFTGPRSARGLRSGRRRGLSAHG